MPRSSTGIFHCMGIVCRLSLSLKKSLFCNFFSDAPEACHQDIAIWHLHRIRGRCDAWQAQGPDPEKDDNAPRVPRHDQPVQGGHHAVVPDDGTTEASDPDPDRIASPLPGLCDGCLGRDPARSWREIVGPDLDSVDPDHGRIRRSVAGGPDPTREGKKLCFLTWAVFWALIQCPSGSGSVFGERTRSLPL